MKKECNKFCSNPLENCIFAKNKLFLVAFFIFLLVPIISAQHYSVNVTTEHPFLLANGSYIPAEDLEVGMQLKTIDGKIATVTNKNQYHSDFPFFVYNLEADPYSNFVLPGGVVVHNSGHAKTPIECGSACSGSMCFSGDTLILMPDGTKKTIQNIKINDLVVSWDFKTNKKVISRVKDISINIRNDLYLINGKIKVTPEHPFYTKEKGFISINSGLIVGDHLMNSDGELILINSITSINESIKTYNLLGLEYENFFADDVLVHNTCPPGSPFEGVPEITNEAYQQFLDAQSKLQELVDKGTPGITKTEKGSTRDVFLIDPKKVPKDELPSIFQDLISNGNGNANEPFVAKYYKPDNFAAHSVANDEFKYRNQINQYLKDQGLDPIFPEAYMGHAETDGTGLFIGQGGSVESLVPEMSVFDIEMVLKEGINSGNPNDIEIARRINQASQKLKDAMIKALDKEGVKWLDAHSDNLAWGFRNKNTKTSVTLDQIRSGCVSIDDVEIYGKAYEGGLLTTESTGETLPIWGGDISGFLKKGGTCPLGNLGNAPETLYPIQRPEEDYDLLFSSANDNLWIDPDTNEIVPLGKRNYDSYRELVKRKYCGRLDSIQELDVSRDVIKSKKLTGISKEDGIFYFKGKRANGKFMWTINEDGEFSFLRIYEQGPKIPHPVLARGKRVFGTGEFDVVDGLLIEVNPQTGHYYDPLDPNFNTNALNAFKKSADELGWKSLGDDPCKIYKSP